MSSLPDYVLKASLNEFESGSSDDDPFIEVTNNSSNSLEKHAKSLPNKNNYLTVSEDERPSEARRKSLVFASINTKNYQATATNIRQQTKSTGIRSKSVAGSLKVSDNFNSARNSRVSSISVAPEKPTIRLYPKKEIIHSSMTSLTSPTNLVRESVSSNHLYTRNYNSKSRRSINIPSHKKSSEDSPVWAFARPNSSNQKGSSKSLISNDKFSAQSSFKQTSFQSNTLQLPIPVDAEFLSVQSLKRYSRSVATGIEDIEEMRESIEDHLPALAKNENYDEFKHIENDENELKLENRQYSSENMLIVDAASETSEYESPPNNEKYLSADGNVDYEVTNNNDYYDYLMMSQRHASTNFIHKIDSSEVIWQQEQKQIKMIGSYLLGDQIGKGSFGKVKEGRCSETLQRVAVKIINRKRLKKVTNGVENVISEIKLLKKLKHKNIIKLIDVYCKVEDSQGNIAIFDWFPEIENDPIEWRYDDGTSVEASVSVVKWYLIFEYCPCSLQVLVEQEDYGKLTVERSRDFFNQLTEGLGYLHSQGVIHRDIKPGNMLVTQDGILKIADFGIAEQFSMYDEKEMKISTFAGTHQFLCPEITEGLLASFSGEKVDIWAAGVTLFNLLTGGYPFDTEDDGNLLSLYEKISSGTFTMPKFFDSDLQDLLQNVLQKDPDTRFCINEILKHPWTGKQSLISWKQSTPILSYPENSNKGGNQPAPTPTANHDDIEKQPFTFRPHAILSYVLKKNKRDLKKGKLSARISPCETTLIPYLEFLYGTEIEAELFDLGIFGSNIYNDETFKKQSSGTFGSILHKIGSKSRIENKDTQKMQSKSIIVE